MIRSWVPVVVMLTLLLLVPSAWAQDGKDAESKTAAAEKKAEALRKRIEEITAAREKEYLRQAAIATRALELQKEYEEYRARRASLERASGAREALRARLDELVKKRSEESAGPVRKDVRSRTQKTGADLQTASVRLRELRTAAQRALATGDYARAAHLCRAAHRTALKLDEMLRAEALVSRMAAVERRLARIELLLGRIARSLER